VDLTDVNQRKETACTSCHTWVLNSCLFSLVAAQSNYRKGTATGSTDHIYTQKWTFYHKKMLPL